MNEDNPIEAAYRRMRELARDAKVPEEVRATPKYWAALKNAADINTVYQTDDLMGGRTLFGLKVVIDPTVTDPRGFEVRYRHPTRIEPA